MTANPSKMGTAAVLGMLPPPRSAGLQANGEGAVSFCVPKLGEPEPLSLVFRNKGRGGERWAMNGKNLHLDDGVLIGHRSWDEPLCVSRPAFRQFTRRLDSQLRLLVARWAYAAAPNARILRAPTSNRRRRPR